MRRGVALLAAAGLLLLPACTSSSVEEPPDPPIGGESIEPSETTVPSPTATGTEDPFAVPDEIDEEYLTLVVEDLERTRSAFFRWLIDSEVGEEPPADVEESYRQSYVPQVARGLLEMNLEERDAGETYDEARRPYGQYRVVSVDRILRADPECPWFIVSWDASEILKDPEQGREAQLIGLTPSRFHAIENASGWLYRSIVDPTEFDEADFEEELEARALCRG